MEKKKQKDKKYIILIVIIVILAITCAILTVVLLNEKPSNPVAQNIEYIPNSNTDNNIFTNYQDYYNYINSTTEFQIMGDNILSEKDFINNNVAVSFVTILGCAEKIKEYNVTYENDTIIFNLDMEDLCGLCAPEYILLVKKVDKDINEVQNKYRYINEAECDDDPMMDKKPMIYIYPEEEMDLTVKLGNKEVLTSTYPLYKDKWNIHVDETGNIYDYDTKRNYYGLYWEGIDNSKVDMSEGFVIEGKETVEFFEEKLAYLGLNEREINEFIVYWIARIENNNYNFIRFKTEEEINNYMPLELSEKPDTIIRVLVDIVPLENKIEVKKQELTKKERKGFTVVEWGASYIN